MLRPYVGTETVSVGVLVLGAAPFAALGFVKYNGMTAEKAIYAWIKSVVFNAEEAGVSFYQCVLRTDEVKH